jgi:RNA polymerase sigma factor (sigma-70 family)
VKQNRLPPALPFAESLRLLNLLHYGSAPEEERQVLEERIVGGNLRLCHHLVREWQGLRFDADSDRTQDLLTVAYVGLLRAVRLFIEARSDNFPATVRSFVSQALAAADSVAPADRTQISLDALSEQYGRDALEMLQSADDVEVIAVDHEELVGVLGAEELGTKLASDGQTSAFDATALDGEYLGKLVDTLPDREALVVRLRFGLVGCAPHELAEIGALIGVSKQRTQAILNNALAKVRAALVPSKAAA